MTPYLFGGGGTATIHEEGTSGQNRTKGAGTFGGGLKYRIPGSRFEMFGEGAAWAYKHRGFQGSTAGFDKTQLDVSYSIPI